MLGDKDTIRVFSIDYIKGLEFEAVFFHNMEKLQETNNQENLLKHLYVGLSRATSYLAVTIMQPFDQKLDFLNQIFETKELDWEIKV